LGRVSVDSAALDILFTCVESFTTMIEAASQGEEIGNEQLDLLLTRLESIAEGRVEDSTGDLIKLSGIGDDVLAVLTEYEEHRLRENLRKGRGLYMLRTAFDLSNFDMGLAELDAAIQGLGEVITKLPSSEASNPEMIAFDIIVGSDRSREEIAGAVADDRVDVIALQRRATARSPKPEPEAVEVEDATASEIAGDESSTVRSVAQTVRVDIRRLDRLMNLVGELSLILRRMQNKTHVVRRELGFAGVAADLFKINRNFERRLSELQSGIMEVRMVPLANLFERMVRIGRRMARELEREVRIELAGKETELDKLIVEELADPLMHIIRNAIDHGIEPPMVRQAAGKPKEGAVRLSAAALGNHVVVEVTDDGRGIDVGKLLQVAVERGLVDSEHSAELSRREAFNLLFLPGFSTRADVSEFSGRGVGLDVVKTNITKLSGVIGVNSVPGEGTTMTITLPITLAIIPALVVTIADQTYAIPLNNVLETVHVDASRIQTIDRREVLSVRGATVPLVDLRSLFGLTGERPSSYFGVLLGAGDTRMALVVDHLGGHQDIVIKSLGKHLSYVPGIAGATELGSQKTILVIDTVELLNELATGQIRDKLAG